MEFTHQLFTGGPKEQIPAMNRVKNIIKSANFSGIAFPFSKGYAAWETDEVISMYCNMSRTSEANGHNSSKWTGHSVGLPKTFKMVKMSE